MCCLISMGIVGAGGSLSSSDCDEASVLATLSFVACSVDLTASSPVSGEVAVESGLGRRTDAMGAWTRRRCWRCPV